MLKFFIHILLSVILAIVITGLFTLCITFVTWDYAWIYNDSGLTFIRILLTASFVLGLFTP